MDQDFNLGSWVVSPKLNSLSRHRKTMRLEPKVMQVLVCLAEAGDVVSKETLMRRVWTDTFVTDDVLTRSISELRKVFEDDPKHPQYIQTIPKGGYRLLVPVVIEPEKAGVKGTGGLQAASVASSPASAVVASAPKNRPRSWTRRGTVIVASAVVLLLAMYFLGTRSSRDVPDTGGRAMLAVLPFQNLGDDPQQDYFADGLTAEMIAQLGRLPSDRLGVIAWNSMIRYKGQKKSEDEVASAVGANYVLEGTVRRAGNRVRITAELVHIGDRSHVWANSYDGELGDVLALQSRLAREIAGDIRLSLTPEQQALLSGKQPTLNTDGYDAYLMGRFADQELQKIAEKNLDPKIERFQKAIRLNPGFAPSYVQLAIAYRILASEGYAPPKPTYAAARASAEKALQLDPTMGEAHRELAWIDWRYNWDFAAAERETRRALELNPNDSNTREHYALYLKSMRRFDEALEQSKRARELSPLDADVRTNAGTLLALMHRDQESSQEFRKALNIDRNSPYVHERLGAVKLWQGRQDEAIEEFRKAADLSGDQTEQLAWLAYAFAAAGRRSDAQQALQSLQHLAPGEYLSPFYLAMVYTGLDEKDQAFASLEKAYEQRDEWMVYLNVYPEFNSLRGDPRFQKLQQQMGLPK